MIAALWWEQPEWLVVVFAIAGAQRLFIRLRRWLSKGRQPGTIELVGEPHLGRRTAIPLVGVLLAIIGKVAFGSWLVHVGTSTALGLLGVLALIGMIRLTVGLYRRQMNNISKLSRAAILALRLGAGVLLLLVLARPVWDWVETHWQKPLLVVLLDQSESMAITDLVEGRPEQTRAQLANAAMRSSRGEIARLEDFYEVRLRGVGAGSEPIAKWWIEPEAQVSALAGTVRDAGRIRSQHGAPLRAVLLISDGGENVGTARELREVAAELAAQGSCLLAAGVGPAPGETPSVDLDPLLIPRQLGPRDRLRVPVSAYVHGCAGATLAVELLWNAKSVARHQVRLDYDSQHIGTEFDAIPPAPGVQRLTVRVTLPTSLGGHVFQTSAIVDVRDERIRVLYVEETPHTEVAFVSRALQADPRLDLIRRFKMDDTILNREQITWSDYDVIILGYLPARPGDDTLDSLAQAVTEDRVGLMLAGGRRLFNDQDYSHSPLAAVSAVRFVTDQFGLAGPLQFVPTEAGLSHPILRGPGGPADEWLALPPLGGAALLGSPKAIATVLAEDAAGRPLLVAHEVGCGRCVAAAWESTWAWALASDQGSELHRRMWRQLILWLANRRPRAWVLADQPVYALAALASGQSRVHLRAGVSALESSDQTTESQDVEARLELVTADERYTIQMEPRGGEWVAELPTPTRDINLESAGEYTLEFSIHGLGVDDEIITAHTGFTVVETQLEHQAPTANLALLQSAARETMELGGVYHDISELPELLTKLTQSDPRQKVSARRHYRLTEREPWVLLIALTAVLGLEWALRKRLALP